VTVEDYRNGAGTDATSQRTHFSRDFSSNLLKDVRDESSRGQVVAMMQAAESRHGNDLATCTVIDLGFTSCRSFLLQCEMRSVFVVIADVLAHQSLQMPFVEHDDVVEQIPSTVANPALCNAVLPRTAKAGSTPPGSASGIAERSSDGPKSAEMRAAEAVGGDPV
jgi:hypothetical protein